MWPDRVSNPRTSDLRARCPTDCATRPGPKVNVEPLFYLRNEFRFSEVYQSVNYVGSRAR